MGTYTYDRIGDRKSTVGHNYHCDGAHNVSAASMSLFHGDYSDDWLGVDFRNSQQRGSCN